MMVSGLDGSKRKSFIVAIPGTRFSVIRSRNRLVGYREVSVMEDTAEVRNLIF